jgi:4-amino-4-deoxy-L-arabinose transferase-like glycosyltransferase
LYGDEGRYIGFAQNLFHGFYSPAAPNINLWNGPGYPLVLMPFIALHIPSIYLSLSNALFMYLSVVFLYQACSLLISKRIALFCALLWAIYPNMVEMCLSVYTEVFTSFMISALLYAVALFYKKQHIGYLVAIGLILGFITLTKIIFGYVLLVGLLMSLTAMVIKQWQKGAINSVYIMLVAFMVTAPYLFYTYKLTHKFFYWGNSGGMSLYWMSTPFDNEYGDWKEDNLHNPTFPTAYGTREGDSLLRKNHQQEINHINTYVGVQRDSAYKAIAIHNIKQYPGKYRHNYYYNVSRMFFDFPYSYYYHNSREITNILTGSLLLWCMVVGLVISIINFRILIYPIKLCLLITAIYLLLTSALSAYPRQLDIVVPVLLFWLAFMTDKVVVGWFRRS